MEESDYKSVDKDFQKKSRVYETRLLLFTSLFIKIYNSLQF